MKKLLLALGLLGLSGSAFGLNVKNWKEQVEKITCTIKTTKISDQEPETFKKRDIENKTHLYQLVQAFKPLINDSDLKKELGGGFSWWRRWTGIGTTPQTDYQQLEKYLFPFIQYAPLYVDPDREIPYIIYDGLKVVKNIKKEHTIFNQINKLVEAFEKYNEFLIDNWNHLIPIPNKVLFYKITLKTALPALALFGATFVALEMRKNQQIKRFNSAAKSYNDAVKEHNKTDAGKIITTESKKSLKKIENLKSHALKMDPNNLFPRRFETFLSKHPYIANASFAATGSSLFFLMKYIEKYFPRYMKLSSLGRVKFTPQ